MKFLLLCFLCVISFCSFAQSQKELVKKLGIKKIITVTQEEGYDDKTTVVYFNDKGNDTSTHTYGKRYQYAAIDYDKQNRVIKRQTFWDNGKPAMTFIYTYAKNESFRVDDEDAEFKMKSTSWYNAKGNFIKVKVPDSTIRTYTYDAKGNTIKFQSTSPGKKAKTQTAKHLFDKREE